MKKSEREINEQKEKEEYDVDTSCYLSRRKKRDIFRENLIKTIMGFDDDKVMDGQDWMTDDDMDILRYYYYIMYGVDDDYVASMDDQMLQNILDLLSPKFVDKYKSTLDQVVQEAKEDYKLSVKKAVVDFVLEEPLIHSNDDYEQVQKLQI